jgi:hypothetical protein
MGPTRVGSRSIRSARKTTALEIGLFADEWQNRTDAASFYSGVPSEQARRRSNNYSPDEAAQRRRRSKSLDRSGEQPRRGTTPDSIFRGMNNEEEREAPQESRHSLRSSRGRSPKQSEDYQSPHSLSTPEAGVSPGSVFNAFPRRDQSVERQERGRDHSRARPIPANSREAQLPKVYSMKSEHSAHSRRSAHSTRSSSCDPAIRSSSREPSVNYERGQGNPSMAPLYTASAPTRALGTYNNLSWRLDPQESLSDWQIKVVRKDSGDKDVYHVHRMVIAVGPRHSEYFADLFQNRIRDNKSHCLGLEMSDGAAAVFPMILDYMYGEDDLASVRSKTDALSVYNHAEYFQMPGLMKAVANWFRKRLKLSKVSEFITQVGQFNASEPLIEVAVEKCADKFDDIGPQLAGILGPAILTRVLETIHLRQYIFHQRSDYVCELVLECVQTNKLDYHDFQFLTNEKFMPSIPPRSALKLLIVDAEFESKPGQLNNLEIRCARSLARNWEQLCFEFEAPEAMADCLSCLKSSVLAEIMVRNANFDW